MPTFLHIDVLPCFLSTSLDALLSLPADRGNRRGLQAGARWKAAGGVSSRTDNPEILRLMLIQIVKMSRVRFLQICNGVNRKLRYVTLHIDPLFHLFWNVSIKVRFTMFRQIRPRCLGGSNFSALNSKEEVKFFEIVKCYRCKSR